MKVFVTGINGQLGHDVVNELVSRSIDVVGSDITDNYQGCFDNTPVCTTAYKQLDITDELSVQNVFEQVKPDVVIHCAAWTAVDLAEEEEYKENVTKINVFGTKNIAQECKKLNAKMVYLSTDYVFDGNGEKPWNPDCKEYAPLNHYGQTKLEGELAVKNELDNYFIVRIAWVFGLNGKNFIKTMLNLGKKYDTLRVVNDQIGTPTYTLDLAKLLVDMIYTEKYGTYHATNEGGYISWYDFACEIFKLAAELKDESYAQVKVLPVTTVEYGVSKAKRPFNSRLDKTKLKQNGFNVLPDWKDALKRYLTEVEV